MWGLFYHYSSNRERSTNRGGWGDEESEELTAPFPGGSTDFTLLQSFKTHIASHIWNDDVRTEFEVFFNWTSWWNPVDVIVLQKREPLKCISHTTKLSDWKWDDNTPNQHFVTYIQQSGLLGLTNISYRRANRFVIFTFVELWQPETNTFHMSFGEMTITLDDVFTLCGYTYDGSFYKATPKNNRYPRNAC